MSREDKMTILSKRALKRIFIGSKYSLNIAQDPTYPSIWKYLSRNTFDHKRNSFLSNVPGGQKWKSLSSDSLLTLTLGNRIELDINRHQNLNHRSHHCCHRPDHRQIQHKPHVSSWPSRIPSLVPRLPHQGYCHRLLASGSTSSRFLTIFTQPYLTVSQKLDWSRQCLRFRHVWYFVLPGHFRNRHWLEKCEKYTGNNLWPY